MADPRLIFLSSDEEMNLDYFHSLNKTPSFVLPLRFNDASVEIVQISMPSTVDSPHKITPVIEGLRGTIAALVSSGASPRRIAHQLKIASGSEDARSLKILIQALRRTATKERTEALLQEHGSRILSIMAKHGPLTKAIAHIGDPSLTLSDVLWWVAQRRIDEVRGHLDEGRNFQSLADLLGLPSSVSADLRRALIINGIRRRTRQEAKQKLLAQHHAMIKSMVCNGGMYKDILAAIGNEELTVPDLTRYVVTNQLPARLRGAPSGCQYNDQEAYARKAAFAISERSKGRTLEEIGEKLELTKEGVRQMLLRANLPAQRCLIAQRRLKIIPDLLPLLQQNLSYKSVAQAWNTGKSKERRISTNFVAGLCAAAEKKHYEQLDARLEIAKIHRPDVRIHWSFLTELIAGMAKVRAALALRSKSPSDRRKGRRKVRDPKVVAEERRERLAHYVRSQPALYMTTMAKASKLERSDIQDFLYGASAPTDAEWSKLCVAYPDLEQLGYEMPFPDDEPEEAKAKQQPKGS